MSNLVPMKNLHSELSRAFDLFHDRFFQDIDNIFGTSGSLVHNLGQSEYPKVNVLRDKTDMIFEVSVPQYNPDEIEVMLEGDVLTIKGKSVNETDDKAYLVKEIAQRAFARSWKLPSKAHEENIEASYDRGILKIVVKNALPEAQEEAKRRKIEIKKLK